MPRSTREYLLRYVDQAINDYDRALHKLHATSETYGPKYPQHQKAIDMIAVETIRIQDTLKTFRNSVM